ncbi:MAG: T9SS type A sorting domain-containing protein, partial [Aureispira sp.]|nr:T9SS type A sorting domain-containing protein [Aureispira sp.]
IQTACNSYTWIDGNNYTSNNNTATHIVTNAQGCDSIITLNLTINNSTTGTDIQTACNSYTWIDGNNYTSNNNTATHIVTNVTGCDSVITLDLTIHTVDTIVTQSGVTLMANQTVGGYQWIDCNNGNSPIAGATAQSFTALVSGDYAVIITVNNCRDTSSCFNIVVSSILRTMDEKAVLVYPNPTIGQVTIEFEEVIENGKARLVDVNGRLLLETILDGQKTIQWNINEFPTAVYFLELQTSKGIYKRKIIKK